jgi:hypothetical protein
MARKDRIEDRAGAIAVREPEALIALNRRLLSTLAEAAPSSASNLHARYLAAAYPTIYPDEASAHALYDLALMIDDLTAAQRHSLEALRASFDAHHAALSEQMAEGEQLRRHAQLRNAAGGPGIGPLWEALAEIGMRREELNQKQIDVIRGVLTPAQMSRLPAWDFEKSPPERPWDRTGRR